MGPFIDGPGEACYIGGMVKPKTFTETIKVLVPAGTKARICRAVGVKDGDEPAYGVLGDYARKAMLEKLERDEDARQVAKNTSGGELAE